MLRIPASATNDAAVNSNGIKMLLDNGLIIFFNNGQPTFLNGPRSLSNNPTDCIVLYICVVDNFTLADELFAKAF